ncbi:MAG: cofactor-independent phosphoglycerate mutase, partial [Chloroflexi bacterium]|nr:cofactor-independent phosphoglycerate mutase [Chloroflexota bacterium]
MKYCILITDGAADYALDEFNGQTALQAAYTPYFDRMASEGEVGLTLNVPSGMEPSSAIACMSVIGYNPQEYYKGRASIEALSLGVSMEQGSSLFRCNFVNVKDGVMHSYNAGDIQSEEAAELIKALNDKLGSQQITFYPGVNYRHILKIKDGGLSLKAQTTAPHDISDKPILGYTPSGRNKDLLNFLMDASKEVLKNHPVNKARIKRGELPATQIWLFWGAPPLEKYPSMQEKYGLKGAMSSAVSLLFGLGIMTGMNILHIDGVTDIDTNDYYAQIKGSLSALN